MKPVKYNILLITADQLRQDASGCYGNTVCKTPNLDALAKKGTVFTNAFTPNPICVPARASITTGNYSHRATGVKGNGGLIRDDQPRLAVHFGSCGYRTAACGKLHYVPYAPPGNPRLTHGFEIWDSCESGRIIAMFDPENKQHGLEDYIDFLENNGWKGYSRAHGIGNNDVRPCPSPLPEELHADHWVADRTIARMKEFSAGPSRPFLIWCSFQKPHAPLDPPWDYARLYDPRTIPPPVGDESMLANRNPYIEYTRSTHGLTTLSPQARQVIKAYYYSLITFQDVQIGRILKTLDELGIAKNTIIVFSSDHGDLMGDFGAYFKCNFLEGSVRVPMIISAPERFTPGGRNQLVGLQDILPTLTALTGCPLKQQIHGEDLTELIDNVSAPGRPYYYSQCSENQWETAMVTDGRFKFCYSCLGPTEELYDLSADRHELNNLAIQPGNQALLEHWRMALNNEARRLGDFSILDGNGLVKIPFDRNKLLHDLPITGMGWRWY